MEQQSRINIIDALRGFSLAGIVIVHMVEQYVGSMAPEGVLDAARTGIADSVVDAFIFLLLRGKFFALFSFLFGLSFFIQMDNADRRGTSYEWRFIWRAFLLLIIGYLHHMFYRGDILTIYAVLAVLLVPFHRLDKRWSYIALALIFLGIIRLGVFYAIGDSNVLTGMTMEPDDIQVVENWEIIKNGSLPAVLAANATEGMLMKTDFQIGIFYRGYLTFGFFIIGMLVGQSRYFEKFRALKSQTKKLLWWSIGAYILLFIASGWMFTAIGENMDFTQIQSVAAMHIYDLSNTAMAFIIILLFVLAYNTLRGERLLSIFAPYGRMALTNYVMQTLIGTCILYGWGLGYLGHFRNIHLFVMALVIIGLQMLFSKWWLGRFRYGPLEGLWRSGTKMEWQSFGKN